MAHMILVLGPVKDHVTDTQSAATVILKNVIPVVDLLKMLHFPPE